jgi:hypothetical protein
MARGDLVAGARIGDHRAVTRSPSSCHPRRRVLWSEFVPYRELQSPALLGALSARKLALRVAVMPDQVGEVARLQAACAAAEVELGLWPLLDDADGRWASCDNAPSFAEHARVVTEAACRDGQVAAIALDLEPPIGWVRAALTGRLTRARRSPFERGASELVALIEALRGGARRIEAAAIPAVLADDRRAGWQRALGTPVDVLPVDHVSVMLYTTLIEGYSRSLLRRADARALLAALARATRHRYGRRAGVSLGVVAGGALGDERGYRDPAELADDVAVARAAGVDALALYGLDGILGRPPLEAWLDTFAGAPPPPRPAETWRARAALAALSFASPALAALARR